jgi:hypothetical protein
MSIGKGILVWSSYSYARGSLAVALDFLLKDFVLPIAIVCRAVAFKCSSLQCRSDQCFPEFLKPKAIMIRDSDSLFTLATCRVHAAAIPRGLLDEEYSPQAPPLRPNSESRFLEKRKWLCLTSRFSPRRMPTQVIKIVVPPAIVFCLCRAQLPRVSLTFRTWKRLRAGLSDFFAFMRGSRRSRPRLRGSSSGIDLKRACNSQAAPRRPSHDATPLVLIHKSKRLQPWRLSGCSTTFCKGAVGK